MSYITAKQRMQIIAKAWADEDYKARLLSNPAIVLMEEGIDIPEGITIKIVEASDNEAVFVFPQQTAETQLEDIEDRISAFLFL